MEGKTIKHDSIFSASVTGCLAILHHRPKFGDCSTPRSSALLASLQAQMFIQVSKKKKKRRFFSWAKGTQKCVGQRLAVNTYKFLSHPGGSDLLNSLCVASARSLLWHIPVCPWKEGVFWGQSWGWCEQQSRGDEIKSIQGWPLCSFLKIQWKRFPFPWKKIYEALLVQRQPPAQSLTGAIEVSPCSWERQGKQRATLP